MQSADAAEIPVLTLWAELPEGPRAVEADPERDRLFRDMALAVATDVHPWLPALLRDLGGHVVAYPGRFFVCLPTGGEQWIELPAVSARLLLLPWAEDGEAAH